MVEAQGVPAVEEESSEEYLEVQVVEHGLEPPIESEFGFTDPATEDGITERLVDLPALIELVNDLVATNTALQHGFERLERSFDSKIKYDTSKEKIIESLHRELQVYRDGLHARILRPVLVDLISMGDDMASVAEHAKTAEDATESELQLRRSFLTFLDTIEEILYRNGVIAYQEEGDRLVSRRQRSIKVVETDDPDKDRHVAERVRKGYEFDGKVLRPEMVATYRYVEPNDDLPANHT